jgi:transcriptional regulator GlxA family with amidase domain
MADPPTFDQYSVMSLDPIGAGLGECSERVIVAPASRGKSARCVVFSKFVSRRIEEFVSTRLEGKVDIAELAVNFGYSSSHFFRVFRRTFGMSPHAYVMRHRLALAQELLTRTDLCLAEVALRAGFCDQSHLSRRFRRSAGLPPRAFRARHRLLASLYNRA